MYSLALARVMCHTVRRAWSADRAGWASPGQLRCGRESSACRRVVTLFHSRTADSRLSTPAGAALAMALCSLCAGVDAPRATVARRTTPAAVGVTLHRPRAITAVCSATTNERSIEALVSLTRRGLLAGAALAPLTLQQQPVAAAGRSKMSLAEQISHERVGWARGDFRGMTLLPPAAPYRRWHRLCHVLWHGHSSHELRWLRRQRQ